MRRSVPVVLLLSLLALPLPAAIVSPPTVAKSFSPSSVATNQTSLLTITLSSSNSSPLTIAQIVDHFPAGLSISGTPATTCAGGTVIPSAFGSQSGLTLSGGTIPANGSCSVTAMVFAANPGTYQNDTGTLFAQGISSLRGATAILNVFTPVPALGPGALLALGLFLACVGAVFLRRG